MRAIRPALFLDPLTRFDLIAEHVCDLQKRQTLALMLSLS